MNNEKIIEIAIRYGCLELCNSRWVFSENGLRKFARVLIEEDRKTVDDEPVAWLDDMPVDGYASWSWVKTRHHQMPLYRRPQLKALLEDEEIEEVYMRFPTTPHLFAKAIEQKLWEKAE